MTNAEKYTNVFVETLEIKEDQVEGLEYQAIPEWDSVGHMSLIAAMEEAFDIMMDTDDIIDFSSFEKGKDILSKNGYNVVGEAENGAKAVEKYAELKPDLVLMDITMPEMDGIAALKSIKSSDPGATVIMCSAMGQQAMVIESIQAGAKDFIVKPFQPDRVIEAVKKVVG